MYTATILNRFKTKKSALLTVALVALSQILLSWGVVFASGLIPSKEGVFYACYVTHASGDEREGQLRVVSDPSNCQRNETAVSWNKAGPIGPQGPQGEFSGHFASPNGAFSIDVDDTGISLQGPSGRIQMTADTILLEREMAPGYPTSRITLDVLGTLVEGGIGASANSQLWLGSTAVVLESEGHAIIGSNDGLMLGGSDHCRPVARNHDPVDYYGGRSWWIVDGSETVFVCE